MLPTKMKSPCFNKPSLKDHERQSWSSLFTELLCGAAQLRLQSHLGMSLQWEETALQILVTEVGERNIT